jgi:phage terminase large subunit GpA-like protein
MSRFASLVPVVNAAAEAFRPPRRIRVSEGAQRALKIQQPGGYSGPWSPSETPYMVEPMDMLASRMHEAVCFVGPARSGKTLGLLDAWFAHNVSHDPGDMLIVQMSQDKAREYSKIRIDRAIRYSPEIRERMSTRVNDDNTHDKLTRNGMWIRLGWPTASQLASSDYRFVALTDYDRMPDDVSGEGAPFALALKRTQTFLSRGMCMVESSPGREYADPNWRPSTPHEAPPASGILGIYNRSDRRRWYWKCPDCGDYFEASPGLKLFATLPDIEELLETVRSADLTWLASQHALVCCPRCGSQIEAKWKPLLNDIRSARWVADGQSVTPDGELVGDTPRASIAGYWLGGVAAAYQAWESILLRYLQGLREYALTGSETTLRTTTNTDQGVPYMPRHLVEEKGGALEARIEPMERYVVPEWTRFVLAAVDVQGGVRARFVVQVHAIGEHMESAVIDRYDITDSPRDKDARVDPAGYAEDWDLLTEKVLNSTYRIADGREIQVLRTAVDIGGEAGVSAHAYAWRKRLAVQRLHDRVILVKGEGSQKEPVKQSHARDSRGRRMRDVPILTINTDYFKEQIASSLRRQETGANYMHFPDWLKSWFFDELRSETRLPSGKWKKIRARNEALDCWVYIWAVAYLLGPADPRRPFPWSSPPPWAASLDGNNHVITRDERRAAAENKPVVAPPEPRSRNRREGSYVQGWRERDPFDAGSQDNWNFRRKPFVRDW